MFSISKFYPWVLKGPDICLNPPTHSEFPKQLSHLPTLNVCGPAKTMSVGTIITSVIVDTRTHGVVTDTGNLKIELFLFFISCEVYHISVL